MSGYPHNVAIGTMLAIVYDSSTLGPSLSERSALMSSSKILLVFVAAFVGLAVLIAPTARSENAHPLASAAPATSPPTAEQQKAAMDAWAAAARPGPEHEWIKRQFVGDWDADVQFFGAGGGGNSKGVMHCKMILGDRYLQLDYAGNMDGPDGKPTPFHGVGIGGYDISKKKFTNLWIDEMSTGVMSTEGTRNGNVMTLDGQCTEPMSGQPMKVREVITVVDNDHHKYELWMTEATWQLCKMMEIMYTRKG
jgi:hypothetical protein